MAQPPVLRFYVVAKKDKKREKELAVYFRNENGYLGGKFHEDILSVEVDGVGSINPDDFYLNCFEKSDKNPYSDLSASVVSKDKTQIGRHYLWNRAVKDGSVRFARGVRSLDIRAADGTAHTVPVSELSMRCVDDRPSDAHSEQMHDTVAVASTSEEEIPF